MARASLATRLRERVVIQRNDRAKSGTGFVSHWVDVAPVFAEVLPIKGGGEAFAQGIQRQTEFFRVTLRFRSDVTPQHRLIWKKRGGVDQALDIRTCADPDNRGEALLIHAETGVPV